MTNELWMVIVAISGIVIAWLSFGQNRKRDAEKAAEKDGAQNTKLDFMHNDIKDIKAEHRTLVSDLRGIDKQLGIVERKADRAHERLDQHEKDLEAHR